MSAQTPEQAICSTALVLRLLLLLSLPALIHALLSSFTSVSFGCRSKSSSRYSLSFLARELLGRRRCSTSSSSTDYAPPGEGRRRSARKKQNWCMQAATVLVGGWKEDSFHRVWRASECVLLLFRRRAAYFERKTPPLSSRDSNRGQERVRTPLVT